MGTPYDRTLQTVERLICSVAVGDGTPDATLINTTNLTEEYRKASLTDREIEIQSITNGVFVHVTTSADAETGTFELWGYPLKGDAEFLGSYTYVADAMVDGEGRFYVDAFTESVAAQHSVTILNFSNGKAVLKFDNIGYKHIVALFTVVSAGTHKAYLRPW